MTYTSLLSLIGSNQAAACIRTLSLDRLHERGIDSSVQLISVLGDDAHARMFLNAYRDLGLDTSLVISTTEATSGNKSSSPTGQAYILLDSHGNNSIIICPGANMMFPSMYHVFTKMFNANGTLVRSAASVMAKQLASHALTEGLSTMDASDTVVSSCILDHIAPSLLESLRSIRIVLLQREIPDSVNLCIALACTHYNQYWKVDKDTGRGYCNCSRAQSESTIALKASAHNPQTTDTLQSSTSLLSSSVSSSSTPTTARHLDYEIYTNQRKAMVPPIFVMQDVGGMGSDLDLNVTRYIHLLSMNETEMGRVVKQAYAFHGRQNASQGFHDAIGNDSMLSQHFDFPSIVSDETGCVYLDPNTPPSDHIPVLSDYSVFSPQSPDDVTLGSSITATSLSAAELTKGLQHAPPFDVSRFIHCANVIIALSSRHPQHRHQQQQQQQSSRAQHSGTDDDDDEQHTLPPPNPYPMLVQVTLGPYGSLLLGYNTIIGYQPAAPVDTIVDTTGCGDTYVGAFCASYVECLLFSSHSQSQSQSGRIDFQYAMKMATTAASITLTRIGTLIAIPTREEIDKRLVDIARMNAHTKA